MQTVENSQNVLRVYTYIYDNEDVILERLTEVVGGVPTTTDTRYVHGPGIDEPLAIARGSNIYFYHADGQGSIAALTNWTEATVEGYNYDTFGNVQRFGNAVKNTYGFTGREYDVETGLYYYRARYYDPETGRFISKDPIGFAGGDANQYNYVLGDPVNWGDPWGLYLSPDQKMIVTISSGVGAVVGGVTFGLTTWGVGSVSGAVIGSSLFGSAAASLLGGDMADVGNAAITGAYSATGSAAIGSLMYNISRSGMQAAVATGVLTGIFDASLMVLNPVFGHENPSRSNCQ